MALDAVQQEFSAVGDLPYNIDAAALSAVRGSLYGSSCDYVVCFEYDDITHTYTYTLYSGIATITGDIVSFSRGDVYTWQYTVSSVTVSASESVSGSFSGSAVGQSPAALQGSFSGTVPRVDYRYTDRPHKRTHQPNLRRICVAKTEQKTPKTTGKATA